MSAADPSHLEQLVAQSRPHYCYPGDRGQVVNDVVRCRDCGRLWVCRSSSDDWGEPGWAQLRWWHLTARRSLARRTA